MYAVIETGGKQYMVANGDIVFVEKLPVAESDAVTFDKVVAVGGDGELKVGTPYLEGITVEGKVLKNGRGKKITVFTYKAKKNEKRKMGHRQPYTKVEITAVAGEKAEKKAAAAKPVKEAEKETAEPAEKAAPAPKKPAAKSAEKKTVAPAEKKAPAAKKTSAEKKPAAAKKAPAEKKAPAKKPAAKKAEKPAE